MSARLGQERRPFRITLKSTMGIALLGLLALQAAAQAQTAEGPVYGFQKHWSLLTFAPQSTAAPGGPSAASGDRTADDSENRPPSIVSRRSERADFNRSIYYKNKLEFSWENGWLPGNIPFVFALFIGHEDRLSGLNYTMVPFIASVRWHMTNIGGPWILRGNWDITFSGAYTMIPRGPETRYWAYMTGFRRNFIQPNWKAVPYLEGRAGLGDINAKAPYASKSLKEENRGQGQDFAFTVMLGGGMRYNFNPRYALSAGVAYMHVSNLYLSEPKFLDEGINVYGPMVGINIRLGKVGR